MYIVIYYMQHFGELHNTHIVSCIISSFLLKKDILSFQNTRGGAYMEAFLLSKGNSDACEEQEHLFSLSKEIVLF